jgi:hypothetical protein
MKFIRYILTAGWIGIFLLPSGCNKKDKWKPAPFRINKQESIYYSEMVSGNLDSTAKSELEAVKKITAEKMKNTSEEEDNSLPPNKKDDSILQKIKRIYNWFLDLF